MSDTTIYDIKLNYYLNDRTSAGLERIGHQAGIADRSVTSLRHTIAALGVGLGIGEMFRAGTVAFIGFNNELEQMQINASAMMAENGMAKSFDAAIPKAQALVEEFKKFSVTSPMTTKEIFQFSNRVNAAVGMAGGNMRDLAKISEYGALYAKTHGIESDQVGLQLTEGIMGNVTSRNRTMMQLLGGIHMSKERFKGLGMQERMDVVEKALTSKSAMDAAKAYEHSFVGELSTLKDQVQLFLGKVGEPLFKSVTNQLKEWNKWINENRSRLEELGRTVSEKLVQGFGMVKTVLGWIVDHRDALVAVAEAYAAIKLGQGIAGMLSAGTSLVGSGMEGGLPGLGAKIAMGFNTAVAAISIGVAIGKGLTSFLDNNFKFFHDLAAKDKAVGESMAQRERIGGLLPGMSSGAGTADFTLMDFRARADYMNKKQSSDDMVRAAGILEANTGIKSLADEVRAANAFTSGRGGTGTFDPGSFRSYQERLGISADIIETEMRDIQRTIKASNFFGDSEKIFGHQILDPTKVDPLADQRRKPSVDQWNINIAKVDVLTEDPDGFAFSLTTQVSRLASDPSQARHAMPRGTF